MKKCRKCGTELRVPDNCNPSQFKNSNYICRDCHSIQGKQQRLNYREISADDRQCRTCNDDLTIGTNWTEARKNNHALICNDCYKTRQKKYQSERQNDPVKLRKQREYRILRDYGVTMDVYEERMASRTTCAICYQPPSGGKPLAYDHCHITRGFRGVLCNSCNTAIGKLGDNVKGVQRAIDYLSKYESA